MLKSKKFLYKGATVLSLVLSLGLILVGCAADDSDSSNPAVVVDNDTSGGTTVALATPPDPTKVFTF